MQFTQYTDNELVMQYRQTNDGRYVGELYKRYRHLVFGVCLKYLKNQQDSEDAVMEIFEKLHLDLKKVDVEHFKSWLYTVGRNHCLMKLRKAGLAVEYPEELPSPIHSDETMTELQEKEALLQALETSISTLKPEQRLCIELFYIQEKSYKQIAIETNMSLNDVKTHIQNGKLNLKKKLQI